METQAVNERPLLETDEILKVTALVYFQEALLAQDFEHCAELAAAARNFGASQDEIEDAIIDYLRAERGPGGRRANPRIKRIFQEK